ncbi:OmpA family protein [Roseibacterium sp. SDUM158017]|uniref:OmpA family protein n=1 Tax=Roseicyclus salinarum TaxID=3036773 RepID=UPI0024155F93|nr:OmpA family protein [Roseibacterium sp. SDUM158017]MDG4647029.1 OmpA family protein [Roseibacterium sp. SDUM158017]
MTGCQRPSTPVVLLALLPWFASAGLALAFELDLPPDAELAGSGARTQGRHEIAVGPWRVGSVPIREIAGMVQRATWRIRLSPGAETVDALAGALEAQLEAQGFEIAFSCADTACGGFDFRHRLDMGRSPEMYVDLGNFRYVSALDDDGAEAVAITVSRGGETLHVHAVHVGDGADAPDWTTPPADAPARTDRPRTEPPAVPQAGLSIVERLLRDGSAALDDLTFGTGASELSDSGYASLRTLAGFLSEDAARRVVLVGHTDSEGGRDSNIALSEARADAVRRYLVDRLGVDPAQVEAAGIGYLAPRATNATEEGREANRRVEVVVLGGG